MNKTEMVRADHAISVGSPPLIPMLWSMRLAVGSILWGKMGA